MPCKLDELVETAAAGTNSSGGDKMALGAAILAQLRHSEAAVVQHSGRVPMLVDTVQAWTAQSNYKLCLLALDIVHVLVVMLKADFRPHVPAVISSCTERLGDSKLEVRERAAAVLQSLMTSCCAGAQPVLERLVPTAGRHRSARVRQHMLHVLQQTLNRVGVRGVHMWPQLLPVLAALLGDATAGVRDAAVNCTVELYRHVGDRLRHDLARKLHVPPARLSPLLLMFDQVRDTGQMTSSAAVTSPMTSSASVTSSLSLTSSQFSGSVHSESSESVRRDVVDEDMHDGFATARSPFTRTTSLRLSSRSSRGHSSNTPQTSVAGAVDEAMFIAQFENVARVQVLSGRDVEQVMSGARLTLLDTTGDWQLRVDALKRLRGVLMCGGGAFEELHQQLRLMVPALQLTIQDLRSQVVREGCITLSYMSQQLGARLDHVCHSLLPRLIELIPNTVKVISTSAVVAARFIVQHTQYWRLVGVVTAPLLAATAGRSRDIRRACAELLEQLLVSWPPATLERHLTALQEAVRRGIADADPHARASCRRAYWSLAQHFGEQADAVLSSLDQSHKKILVAEKHTVDSPGGDRRETSLPGLTRSCVTSRSGSRENVYSSTTAAITTTTQSIQRPAPPIQTTCSGGVVPRRKLSGPAAVPRSTSAIDLQAAQRARARAHYAAAQRVRAGVAARAATNSTARDHVTCLAARDNTVAPPSTSQLMSRGGSPSPLASIAAYSSTPQRGGDGGAALSYAPHSTVSKPTRSFVRGSLVTSSLHSRVRPGYLQRYAAGGANSTASPTLNDPRASLASKFSRLRVSDTLDTMSRDTPATTDSTMQDVDASLAAIMSSQWQQRRDGLASLRHMLLSERSLSGSQLKQVTRIMDTLFCDPHSKVFGMLLDTLQEVLRQHSADLQCWLPSLTSHLLHCLAADLLGSVVLKLQRVLALIRSEFDRSVQWSAACCFLAEHGVTANDSASGTHTERALCGALEHVRVLLYAMEPSELVCDHTVQQAVGKILRWCDNPGGVQRQARAIIVALYDLNTPQFNTLLSQMPQSDQEAAAAIIHQQMSVRHSACIDEHAAATDSPCDHAVSTASSPLTDSHSSPPPPQQQANQDHLITDNYSTLKRAGGGGVIGGDRERDTASQDSGVSQLSGGGLTGSESCNDTTHYPLNNAGCHTPPVADNHCQHLMCDVIGELSRPPPDGAVCGGQKRHAALHSLLHLAIHAPHTVWQHHFRTVLRLLLADIGGGSDDLETSAAAAAAATAAGDGVCVECRRLSLAAAARVCGRPQSAELLLPFAELLFVRVLGAAAGCDAAGDRDTAVAVDRCAAAAAASLPGELVLRVLAPLAQTAAAPAVCAAAIKALTALVSAAQPQSAASDWLPRLMPAVLAAYEHSESLVRKAAVLCLVAVHAAVGADALQPFVCTLSPTKLKLLRVYVRRAVETDGASVSATPDTLPATPL